MFPTIKLKTKEFVMSPELLREVGKQLPGQLSNMTFTEMVELWKAIREIGQTSVIANLIALFRGKSG